MFAYALPIYLKNYKEEMNISSFYCFDCEVNNSATLKITGATIYRVFDNGALILVGPARANKGIHRVDEIKIGKGKHHFVIELSYYGCHTYYFQKQDPFIIFEVVENKNILAASGKSTVECYLHSGRYQKVTRFSYQRGFSESYHFKSNFQDFLIGKDSDFKKEAYEILKPKQYGTRNVSYPKFTVHKFEKIEEGEFDEDDKLKKYEDRYMYSEHILIFNKNDWEVNPNDIVSSFVSTRKNIGQLKNHTYQVFKLDKSITGFLMFDIEVLEDAELYFYFDEVGFETKEALEVKFFRNTTHNIVSYELKKGRHQHIFFESYTINFLKLAIRKGKIRVNDLKMLAYENEDVILEAKFEDEKLQKIFDAAINTFKQNSLDVLTDCPSRERAGWMCDAYFTSIAERYLTGANKVEHNSLENYALCEQFESLPKGMIPMCYPADHDDGVFIPNWSMFYILEIEKYQKKYGTDSLVEKSKEKIRGILSYFEKFENEYHLLENLENWVFVEWSKANDPEFIKGVNFPSNMLYCAVLLAASKLLNDESLYKKSELIKGNINKLGFNGTFYVDNAIRNERNELVRTNNITETNQYYAFYFDICNKNDKKELFDLLLETFGPNRDAEKVYKDIYPSNVIVGDFLRLFILNREGYKEEVISEIKDYFYKMAELTGTLWEHNGLYDSLNHGITSSLVYLLGSCYFGVDDFDLNTEEFTFDNNHLGKNGYLLYSLSNGKKICVKLTNGTVSIEKK